jgi:hypothetical protein
MSKFYVTATWDDVPHLSEQAKAELLKEIPSYQRDARTRGTPQLGAGAVFPIAETDIAVTDFFIPDHWRRGYALDVGWNKTAAIWGAHDNEAGVTYLYSEHYRGRAEAIIHSEAIKSRGSWIPGVIDPAANASDQKDGRRLKDIYQGTGLDLENAANSREAGIELTRTRLSEGRLKVFKSLSAWWTEFRTYQRNEHGVIMDEHKYHLMACMRYLILSGRDRWKPRPVPEKVQTKYVTPGLMGQSWMG